MSWFFRKLSPERILVLGFASVIFVGTILLLLPISAQPGVTIHPIDAFFTSTSAVCVTGLVVIDTAGHFNVFGRSVIALLIQIGGLGVSSVGVMFILLSGKKVGLKERILIKESMNLYSLRGVVRLVRAVLLMTLFFESIGVLLNFIVFSQDYPFWSAWGISIFHSISSFNNAGFDILGGFQSLIPYQKDVLLNLTTCGLIILGGLGFYVINEVLHKKHFRSFSLNTKVVLTTTLFLLTAGTLLLKSTQEITWLGAFFQSTSARTAGFSTYNLGGFSNAALFCLMILMFIGASPGGTGGGVKTTTFFTLFRTISGTATNRDCTAFRRKIPTESIMKAFVITTLAVTLICLNTFLISIIEPGLSFFQIFFEVVSAFGTVGLSTGITPGLYWLSKVILIFTMFFGRLGPLTMVCIWAYRTPSNISYGEESIMIG